MGPGFESQRDHFLGCALVQMTFVAPLCGPVWAVLLGAWSVLESLEGGLLAGSVWIKSVL